MKEKNGYLVMTYVFYGVTTIQCCVLADALRRLAKTKIKNKTISGGAVVVYGLASTLEIIGLFVIYSRNDKLIVNYIVVGVAYFLGVSLVGTILYLIGISSIADNAEDNLSRNQ